MPDLGFSVENVLIAVIAVLSVIIKIIVERDRIIQRNDLIAFFQLRDIFGSRAALIVDAVPCALDDYLAVVVTPLDSPSSRPSRFVTSPFSITGEV